MSTYTIEVTEPEVNYLLACINNDIKANGLNAAANGLHMANKIKLATEAQQPQEEPEEEVNGE